MEILKLIMEKGPREGETLTYPSSSKIKIGRVVKGNTLAIKDAGISTKHISIQFDNQLRKWTLCDLDSSNGTVLNGQMLKPYLPSVLSDGDCIKIGELTSIAVKFELESNARPKRNLPRKAKAAAGAGYFAGIENGKSELGLGFGGELGENEAKEPVRKRNLRSGVRKDVEIFNQVEGVSSSRILRSSKKEEASHISENLSEMMDLSVAVEPRKTRGRKKKVPEELPADPDLDQTKAENIVVVPVAGKRTRGRRKGLVDESLEVAESSSRLEENLNNVDEGNDATVDKLLVDELEKVKDGGLGENLDGNNESAQEHVVEKLVSGQEGCEGKEVMGDGSLLKGKEVAEESECMKEGCDNDRWLDLEKMTLGDFFDYLEVQLPKEIHDKTEKIISDLAEKARKCHAFRLQRK